MTPSARAAVTHDDGGLTPSLDENLEVIRKAFQGVEELTIRPFTTQRGREGALVFVSGLQDRDQLAFHVIAPLVEEAAITGEVPENHLARVSMAGTLAEVMDALLAGQAVGLADEWPVAVLYAADRRPDRAVASTDREQGIVGPREAFIESLETNIALVRSRLRTARLKTRTLAVGTSVPVDVTILYIDGRASATLLSEVEARVRRFKVSHVDNVSVLSEALDQSKWSPFPQSIVTERPDVVAMNLLEGCVAIFSESSPCALVAPITFIRLFHSAEDYYLRPALATAVRLLRVIAFVLTTTAVPAYVAVVSYHYEMIPLRVLVATAQNRAGVPFTPLAEALLIDVGVELLREAGVRLPRPLGQTLSVAAALVIGQAILSSHLVSPALLVAVGFTSLASFSIPDYNMFLALRLIRFPITILAGVISSLGIAVAWTVIFAHLCDLEPLGQPYLAPMAPPDFRQWKYEFIRAPRSRAGEDSR